MIANADRDGKPEEAFRQYQEMIDSGVSDLDTYINFAVLTFLIGDYGFNAGHQISLKTIYEANNSLETILGRAQKLYPNDLLPKFWRLYFDHQIVGYEITAWEINEIIASTEAIDPYLYHIRWRLPMPGDILAKLRQAIRPPSFRYRYIASYLR